MELHDIWGDYIELGVIYIYIIAYLELCIFWGFYYDGTIYRDYSTLSFFWLMTLFCLGSYFERSTKGCKMNKY